MRSNCKNIKVDVAVLGLESDRSRLDKIENYNINSIVNNVSSWAKEKDGLGVDLVIDAAGVNQDS